MGRRGDTALRLVLQGVMGGDMDTPIPVCHWLVAPPQGIGSPALRPARRAELLSEVSDKALRGQYTDSDSTKPSQQSPSPPLPHPRPRPHPQSIRNRQQALILARQTLLEPLAQSPRPEEEHLIQQSLTGCLALALPLGFSTACITRPGLRSRIGWLIGPWTRLPQ